MMDDGALPLIAFVGQLLEAGAVLIIVIGFLYATVRYISIQVELDGRWPWQRAAEVRPREPSQS